MQLKAIFESITPQNIKDIPLLADAMEIFIKNLEETSVLSIDIKELFNSENEVIRRNLLKIYLSSLYAVITDVQQNKEVQSKFVNGEGYVLSKNVNDILNDEYFTSNKEFKQRVGTKLGIDYTYLLAKYLQTNEFTSSDDFALKEIKPFHFQTEGSIYRELYENVVKPLSHPLGFTYIYNQLIKNSLADLFGVKKVYTVNAIEVRCLSGNYDVFTPDVDDTNVKANFLSRVNPLTAQLFTEEEYNTYVNVRTAKVVQEVTIEIKNDAPYKSILFTDQTFLEAYTNPTKVYYRNYIDELLDTNNYITQYTTHCSLFLDYNEKFEITYTDNIDQFLLHNTFPEDEFYTNDMSDDIFLLAVSNSGYYLITDEADNNNFYFKALDYFPDEYGDGNGYVTTNRQIHYIGTANATGITNDYYVYLGPAATIDIGTTDFSDPLLWEHVGSEARHEWYLITQR
jgi:hypothetical protein